MIINEEESKKKDYGTIAFFNSDKMSSSRYEEIKKELEKQDCEADIYFHKGNTSTSQIAKGEYPSYLKKREGLKESENKVDYGELDWEYIDAITIRMAKNTKYPPENWKKPMDIKELAKSAIRHARKILQPVEGDTETHLEHAEALGCNGMMINYQLKNYNNGKG